MLIQTKKTFEKQDEDDIYESCERKVSVRLRLERPPIVVS